MENMRWDERRMATHELHCQEHRGDPCSVSAFLMTWMITALIYFLFPYRGGGNDAGAIQFLLFLFLLFPVVAWKVAELYAWLRKLLYKHVLKLPNFLPTRPWEEPLQAVKARKSVDEAARLTRSALYDAAKFRGVHWLYVVEAARAVETDALSNLKGFEQRASDWQEELRRRNPAVTRRTRKEQREQGRTSAECYKRYHECPVITQTNSVGSGHDHRRFCDLIP